MTPPEFGSDTARRAASYWDALTREYQESTTISVKDFHYGPLLPGDRELGLLPAPLKGKRCLELGCGGAQNSLYLARQGAECAAVDVSAKQVAFAKDLAERHGLPLEVMQADMELLPESLRGFDLIHSAYGVPFAADPELLVHEMAQRLNPGGTLLISLGHPVFAGEWLELDDEERGIFLTSYFNPMPDVREADLEEDGAVISRAFPVCEAVRWVLNAGLQLVDLREPMALPVHNMSREDRRSRVPYYSPEWAEQVFELMHFPIVLILKAVRPGT